MEKGVAFLEGDNLVLFYNLSVPEMEWPYTRGTTVFQIFAKYI
jgi:hypothetical protein